MCDKQNELRQAATAILQQIDALTQQQLDAMRQGDDVRLMKLDKQLELVFGEKERAFGALHQHRDEHGC
jgi:hypothetical protein